ncbi:MAG: iron ABC transporter permease [Abyssibacter sp.]|uniref:FecCD family ABC transporter permease n=1 Tax=Abyssibacter sp. TaxID=2320200 RepID=UPI00321A7FCB
MRPQATLAAFSRSFVPVPAFLRTPRFAASSLITGLLIACLVSLTTGAVTLDWSALWATHPKEDALTWLVITELRMPRLLAALATGWILAAGGAALQALFQNPLAEPGLIGVSAGAALGAASLLVMLPAAATTTLLPLAAFVGALATVSAMAALGLRSAAGDHATLLLAGIAVNALAGAGIALLTYLASDTALRQLSFWLFGDLSRPSLTLAGLGLPWVLLAGALLWSQTRGLNLLQLGQANARALGVRPQRLRIIVLVAVALGVGSSVALVGTIAFVGLVIPHLLRLWIGPDQRSLLPLAGVAGANLMVWADVAARSLIPPAELPAGVLTALLGGPFFLLMILWRHR